MDEPEFAAALEYDLITLGLRLRWVNDGVHDVNWRDVLVVVEHAPRLSAIVRHLYPETFQWGLTDQLLATIADGLHVVSWQLGGDKNNQPKPIPRPGVPGYASTVDVDDSGEFDHEPDPFDDAGSGGVFRGVATPLDELNEWLGWSAEPTRDEQIVIAYESGGVTYKQLAEQFGVSASTVGRVVRAAKTTT